MTPDRFQRVDRLVSLTLERRPSERAEFIREACGGEEDLRLEVESLVASHEKEDEFLAEPPSKLVAQLLAENADDHKSMSIALARNELAPGRYKILRELGVGGMGPVYVAHDPELGRKVAIKLIRTEDSGNTSASEGRARLLREAQAMAQLSHPNVIAVHDVGTLGEQVFIAMEYVDGSTLAQWLSAKRRPWREIVSTFAQAGRGLAAAHAAGIVHRDFKPDNVLVGNDGRVRVLDFGLARAAHAADGTGPETPDNGTCPANGLCAPAGILGVAVTEPGKLMGTPAYMAPEQLKGQLGDVRTDQFSFCVALYEALHGERPFPGETVAALLEQMEQKRIGQEPSGVRVPARVRKALLRGLSPEREDRYESMDSLLHELTRRPPRFWGWSAGAAVALAALTAIGWFARVKPTTKQLRSIAVLPMENLSHDPEQEYLADGLTDELITNLARIRSLHVISRTSAIQYKGAKKRLPQIAQELNVDAVVEGTVARWGDRVRIDAKLIHAPTDRHLWANSYQRDLRDILALQSDVARAIAAEVQAELTPQEQSRLASTQTINPEAYEAYLKGRFASSKGTAETISKGVEYFQQAIQKEPNYALAYAGLADAYNLLGFGVLAALPPRDAAHNARAAAIKAIELDDSLSEAHAALGFTKFLYDWEWAAAEKEYRRAVELNLNNATAYHRYSLLLARMARADEALQNIKRAQQLDPLSPVINRLWVESLLRAGQVDQAMEQVRKMLELHSESYDAHFGAGIVYVLMSMDQEAVGELEKASALSGGNASATSWLAHSYIATGKRAEAEKILNDSKGKPSSTSVAFQIAGVAADLGRKDEAFEWLESVTRRIAPPWFISETPQCLLWCGQTRGTWTWSGGSVSQNNRRGTDAAQRRRLKG